MSNRKAKAARRAAAKAAPLLGVAEISYLASIDRISRAEAERELRRTLCAMWPPELSAAARDWLIAICLRYPTVERVQVFLEVFARCAEAAPRPTPIADGAPRPTPIAVELPDGRTIQYVAGAGVKS